MQRSNLLRAEIKAKVKEILGPLFSRVSDQFQAPKQVAHSLAVIDITRQEFEVQGREPRSYVVQATLGIEFSLWEDQASKCLVHDKLDQVIAVLEADRSLGKLVDDSALLSVETASDDSSERRLGAGRIEFGLRYIINAPVAHGEFTEFKGGEIVS